MVVGWGGGIHSRISKREASGPARPSITQLFAFTQRKESCVVVVPVLVCPVSQWAGRDMYARLPKTRGAKRRPASLLPPQSPSYYDVLAIHSLRKTAVEPPQPAQPRPPARMQNHHHMHHHPLPLSQFRRPPAFPPDKLETKFAGERGLPVQPPPHIGEPDQKTRSARVVIGALCPGRRADGRNDANATAESSLRYPFYCPVSLASHNNQTSNACSSPRMKRRSLSRVVEHVNTSAGARSSPLRVNTEAVYCFRRLLIDEWENTTPRALCPVYTEADYAMPIRRLYPSCPMPIKKET